MKKIKVLLLSSPLNSKPSERYQKIYPLGLAYIASMIKGHEVYLFDSTIYKNQAKKAKQIIEKVEPDIIGVSLRNIDDSLYSYFEKNISLFPNFVTFIKKIREVNRTAKIVVGGTGFTIFAREIMNRVNEIDIGMEGESEITFSHYLKKIDRPSQVKGLYLRKSDKVVYTGKQRLIDMNSLKIQKNFDFLDMNQYKKDYSMGVQTKRGCVFRCAYCTYPHIEGRCVRIKSPKKVVDEIETLYNEFGIKSMFFTDSIFNFPMVHSQELCEEIIRRKLDVEWEAYLRPDYVNSSFLKLINKSGCNNLIYSIDALSEKNLYTLHKQLKIKTILDSCELVKKFEDFNLRLLIILNIPFENSTT